MARRNFYEILNETPFNAKAEYKRIYTLFNDGTDSQVAVVEVIEEVFELFPSCLRGRTISLSDFNETYGFNFSSFVLSIELDELILFCEYVWNLCYATLNYAYDAIDRDAYDSLQYLLKTIAACMDDAFHAPVQLENTTIFVPKNTTAIAVSEIAKEDISVSVLEYHHHSLKGNLQRKKSILKLLADDIEPQRKILNSINKTLADNLFQMLQKFVRHNNEDNPYIASLSPVALETCYDDIYQMWLLAKLEIDNLERKKRVEEILQNINA